MQTSESMDDIRVLVIDDSEMELKLYFNSLAKHFEMSFAASASEAWELLHRAPLPDLIILDIMMPNEDGLHLCNRLKENQFTQDIPVIFISSLTGPTIKSQAFELGGADFVTKPPMITELVARIKRHVAIYRKTKRLEALIYIDPLTHLPNASKFTDVLSAEWARCARYWHHLSLLLVSIDNLPKVRENSGEMAYNALTIAIANVLKNVGGRPGDMLASIGNGIYALLLPDCSLEGGLAKADEVMQIFSRQDYATATYNVNERITCTIGVASAAPAGGGAPEDLFKTADDLLFEANQTGRGRVYHTPEIIGFDADTADKL